MSMASRYALIGRVTTSLCSICAASHSPGDQRSLQMISNRETHYEYLTGRNDRGTFVRVGDRMGTLTQSPPTFL